MIVSRHANVSRFALMIASLSLPALVPVTAHAQDAAVQQQLKLAPMSMERALDEIADRFSVRIDFDRSLARRIRSAGVDATSASQAVQQALAGSPLSEKQDEDGVIKVGVISPADPGDIIVTANRNEAETSYGVQSISSATRDGKSLREQPQSTTIITAKVLEDQQVQSISQALRNASGSTVAGSVQGTPGYTIRGFVAQSTSGGLSTPAGNNLPIANVERIEVLKGPAALLSGSGNLGGVVNIVSKHPTTDTLLDVTAEFASYNDKKLIVDGSTALDPDKKFSARLVLQADSATRAAYGYNGRFDNLIAPSIRYKTSVTDITIGGHGSDTYIPLQRFAYFWTGAGAAADAPKVGTFQGVFDRRTGPADSGFRSQEQRFWFDATQKITPWLTLSSRGIHDDVQLRIKVDGPVGALTNGVAFFQRTNDNQLSKADAIDNFARIQFDTGPLKNTMVAGYNYSRYRSIQKSSDPNANGFFFIPDIRTEDLSFEPFLAAETYYNTSITTQNGYYVQDTLDLFGRLHIVGGLRHSSFRSEGQSVRYRASGPVLTVSAPQNYSKTTPNIGAVFDVTPNFSVYGNYIEGFVPGFAKGADGLLLPPITSQNIEGGLKADLFNGKLAIVASYYRLRQFNLPQGTALPNVFTLIAGLESKGFEADVRGTILPGWQVVSTISLANYKFLDAAQANTRVLAQPKTRASLFTVYEVPEGPVKGLGAGVGVYYIGSSYAGQTTTNSPVPAILPATTQIDANLYYTYGKIRLNFGVSNIFDKNIYNPSATTSYVVVQPPRTFRLSATYRFFAK